MDQDLLEIERRASANPADRALADRLDRALLRAGAVEAIQERYGLKFRCPLRFEDLAITEEFTKRRCERCQCTVQLVRAPEELVERVAKDQCVAIPSGSLVAAYLELGRDARIDSVIGFERCCVHESGVRFVDLDSVQVAPEAIELIPPSYAHSLQFVPIALLPSRQDSSEPLALGPGAESQPLEDPIPQVEIACASDASPFLIEDLEFMLDLKVRIALAEPEALARALERYYPDPGDFGELMASEIAVG